MSKICAVTGKKRTFGRNVSFSKRSTSRTYDANIQKHRIYVPELGKSIRLNVSARGMRHIDKAGGLVPALKAQGKTLRDVM